MATRGLVLVTGANGYIAARTVEAFLREGYAVRGTVRRRSSAEPLLKALSEYVERGLLEIVEVPDIMVPGAFDAAMDGGVTAVAHLATPVALTDTDVERIMDVALSGTLSIAESALNRPSIRSFVLMSSIVTVRSFTTEGTYTDEDWNTEIEPIVKEKGAAAGGILIYSASKIAAERAFWAWVDEKKPKFNTTSLCPVWVAGPPLYLPDSPAGISQTNEFIWQVLSGQEYPPGPIGYDAHVDVRDCARMTVWAVESPIADGQRYCVGGNGNYGCPQATADILRAAYPNRRAIIREGIPGEGYMPGWQYPPKAMKVNSDKAVKATGQDWIPYDKMVLDAAKMFEHFL